MEQGIGREPKKGAKKKMKGPRRSDVLSLFLSNRFFSRRGEQKNVLFGKKVFASRLVIQRHTFFVFGQKAAVFVFFYVFVFRSRRALSMAPEKKVPLFRGPWITHLFGGSGLFWRKDIMFFCVFLQPKKTTRKVYDIFGAK